MADATPDWAQDTMPDWAGEPQVAPDWAQPSDNSLSLDKYKQMFMAGAENAAAPFVGLKVIPEALAESSKQWVGNMIAPFLSDEQQKDMKERGYYQTPVVDEIKGYRPTSADLLDPDSEPSDLENAARIGLESIRSIAGPYAGTAFAYMAPLSPVIQKATDAANEASGSKLPGEALESGMDILGIAGVPEKVNNVFLPEKPTAAPIAPTEGPIIEGDFASSELKQLPAPENAIEPVSSEPVTPPENPTPDWAKEPESPKLYVRPSESKDAFNVVDVQGDHVQGGFDSRSSAEDYISSASEPALGHEPSEWNTEELPVSVLEEPNIATNQIPEDHQAIIPGAEAITDTKLAERQMEKPLVSSLEQKIPDEGLFDVSGREQQDLIDMIRNEDANVEPTSNISPTGEMGKISSRAFADQAENIRSNAENQNSSPTLSAARLQKSIPPAEIGKPTSLYTFLRNNGGLRDEGGNLAAMGEKSLIRKNGMQWDDATDLAQQHGYFSERPSVPELQSALLDTNTGRGHFRAQDVDRILKSEEMAAQRQENDPAYIEHYADRLGLDTTQKPQENNRQFINRLKNAIIEFHKSEEGSFPSAQYRRAGLGGERKPTEWALKKPIEIIENATGKLAGDTFHKIGDAYTKVMAPELVSKKALRADAYLAKNRANIAEARNALLKQSAEAERAWDRASDDQRMQFLYDHETGRWSQNDPSHARYQALYDAAHKAESKALGRDMEKGYKENYLPHAWADEEGVQKYFRSPAMVKKYGPNWFNKASTFKLIQEGIRAGFKLKSNNPETMLQNRLMASSDMIARMNLLHDLERDGLATPARAFSVDKRIADVETKLADVRAKFKKASDKINDPKQLRWDFADPAVNRYMKELQTREEKLKAKLDEYKQEKNQYNLSPEVFSRLKGDGFKIIGPDDKVWHLDNDMIPLWKNAMDSRGLWENQGLTGSAYRGWQALRNTWVPIKLGLSLFHPLHVASIHAATGLAEAVHNLTQGGKLANSGRDIVDSLKMGFGIKGLKGGEAIKAWNKPASERTPVEQQIVDTMKEGGFVPKMSERDTIYFRRGFENALHGNLAQKAIVMPIKGMQGIVRAVSAPIFEHWIPALKTDAYLMRARNAILRDPSLVDDAGKRGEILRQIAKDVDRTYGEMNYDALFWNKAVRDAFNASFLSGGWKLAQMYYARGLLAPAKLAYKFAKTGEFNPKDISYNMAFSYIYGAMGLILGAAFTKMMGGTVNSLADMVFPQTGEKDKDGKPIRVSMPFFNKEFYSLGKDINTRGLIGGSAAFAYDQTLFKGIMDTLNNQDYVGRPLISNPSDLNQWAHQAWETVKPITLESYEKAESKSSEFGKKSALAGIGLAPAYANQTPFEQKVLYAYDKVNPSKGDSYTASLKSDLRSAQAAGSESKMEEIKHKMAKQGMTGAQITATTRPFNKPFIDHAWMQLSPMQQRQLIDSASKEEKEKFRLKPMRTEE